MLAPLRFGAGLKGKLLEAMLCGTPSVTTDIGVEGMAGELAWSGRIFNEPKEIASASVELYRNKKKWEQAQKNGIDIVNERFRKEKFESGLAAHLKIYVALDRSQE
jgi:glycosyltransferase involved in cell wall biosynthesis